ncbi:hypothetical protein GCM10009753_39720 [Streptantibioticus ferralitis]
MEISGGPHDIGWTHAEEVDRALLDFRHEKAAQPPGVGRISKPVSPSGSSS